MGEAEATPARPIRGRLGPGAIGGIVLRSVAGHRLVGRSLLTVRDAAVAVGGSLQRTARDKADGGGGAHASGAQSAACGANFQLCTPIHQVPIKRVVFHPRRLTPACAVGHGLIRRRRFQPRAQLAEFGLVPTIRISVVESLVDR